MRKVIYISKKKFEKEKELIKKSLAELDRILKLKKTYLEVFLIEGDFTVHSFEPPKDFPRPDLNSKGLENLGEIYLCPRYAYRTNKTNSANGSYIIFLLIHGLLHLLGYDHKKKSDRIRMEGKEKELMDLL